MMPGSARWGVDAWPQSESVVHVRLLYADDLTLCERGGGPTVSEDSLTLVLEHPNAAAFTSGVTCTDCKEWMHA